jgi:hypothetical protein
MVSFAVVLVLSAMKSVKILGYELHTTDMYATLGDRIHEYRRGAVYLFPILTESEQTKPNNKREALYLKASLLFRSVSVS